MNKPYPIHELPNETINTEMPPHRPYIIYASKFCENSGGSIALHQLCHLLNQHGEKAYIWPVIRYKPKRWTSRLRIFLRYKLRNLVEIRFKTNQEFTTPLATKKELVNGIVIYPEVVNGNPLGAVRVVRWFLNKPGLITGTTEYGENELYFYYAKQFNDKSINKDDQNYLKTLYVLDSIYHKRNHGSREGSCYILRKGRNRTLVHNTTNSILIDNLSHEQAADVFNHAKYCISYDTQTALSKYAALCGCISIVVPEHDVSKEKWKPNIEDRYGVAYGFDDTQWAEDSADKILENFQSQKVRTLKQLDHFIEKTQSTYS